MQLIVDSGSTKTDWCFVGGDGHTAVVHTLGINPSTQTSSDIDGMLQTELCKQIAENSICLDSLTKICFYGAGCTVSASALVESCLENVFGSGISISVGSDMLGAARALCGNKHGVACILGTGANSCEYDGNKIIAQTPALGYILGDEGSGAVLGRLFVNAMFKGRLPEWLRDKFQKEYNLTVSDIIYNVYKKPSANRFLASFAKFIKDNIGCESLEKIVVDNFCDFIKNNIEAYGMREKKINAVGSIAYFFKEQLCVAAGKFGYEIGLVERSPLEKLVKFHQKYDC